MTLSLLGVASGIAAGNPACADGPSYWMQTTHAKALLASRDVFPTLLSPRLEGSVEARVAELSTRLAHAVRAQVLNQMPWLVLGGDHSCAIGTWSGVASAMRAQGPVGLLWVDAHMDAHTFETTPSGNIHGMPVAALLGYGTDALTKILDETPKLKPEHIVMVGIRSYETGEHELLRRLGVRIYFMDEVRARGLSVVMAEAKQTLCEKTAGFGISIDLDGLDPLDAPGVGSPEAQGLRSDDLLPILETWYRDPRFLGLELAEYNPHEDKEDQTAAVMARFLTPYFLAIEEKQHV